MTGTPLAFKPHSKKQSVAVRSALNPKVNITAVITGIQWGKTTVGAWWLRLLVTKYWDPESNFLVTAPTYKILNQATLPAFMKVFRGMGEYTKNDSVFKMPNGPTIYFRTQTDPESVIGMTNVRGIWGDEAGLYTKYFWENLEGRAAFRGAPICITTSPYSLNWIYKEVMVPFNEGKRRDVCLITATSRENPFFSKEFWDKRKASMDPRKFLAMYGGQFERMQGLVYDCFDDQENMISKVTFPEGTEYYAGIDWGFNDPFVIVIRAISPTGMQYQVSEFCRPGLTLPEIVDACKSRMAMYDIKAFYCDPSQPGHIEHLQRQGINAVGANNDIDIGIEMHYALIKTRRYKILTLTSPHTLDELETYHWPEPKDLTSDQSSKKIRPVDQNNHCLDANRYITVSLIHKTNSRTLRVVCPDPSGIKQQHGPLTLNKSKKKTIRVINEYGL